mmetsp:Transcript_24234/g.42902  ORF Transcript_24234/g.42902 Transcript_24234/m.42902 type:complete len:410 (-) Transcript_24234:181-1410(-)
MAALGQYFAQVSRAINACNGQRASMLLRLTSAPQHVSQGVIAAARVRDQVFRTAKQYIRDPWTKVVARHICSVSRLKEGKGAQALALADEAGKACYEIMRSKQVNTTNGKPPNWYLPIVDCVITQLRLSAYAADTESKNLKNQRAAYNFIREFLTACNKKEKNTPLRSLKMGTLFVVNHLFKLCFRINLLRNTANLRTSIEAPGFPPLESFPRSQTVTYKFYLGRLLMMEEKYDKAEECLDYAFKHCHKACKKNKLRILQFLIPVKLLLKKSPHPRLLEKYPFPQFKAVIRAVKTGDLKGYNDALRQNEDFFVQKGVFLVMEKLKKFVYRNLVKKVLVYVQNDDSQPHKSRIYLKTLRAALKVHGVETAEDNFDEIECILANLIYEGLIKGYIAHARCLVVSKKNAFPR